jgi:tetratricopeptide (TPR) repeat protein
MDAYLQGNNCVKRNDYESGITFYTTAMQAPALEDKMKTKILMNKGFCQLKLRNYSDAVGNITQVVQILQNKPLYDVELKNLLAKALTRRALCYENMTEFKRAMDDIEQACSQSSILYHDNQVKLLIVRLQEALRRDKVASSFEPRPDYLVSSSQSLRLSFLTEPPVTLAFGTPIYCKLSLGNEFGLFDRWFYSKSAEENQQRIVISLAESQSGDSAPTLSNNHGKATLGKVYCQVVQLEHQEAFSLSVRSCTGDCTQARWDIGHDGKASSSACTVVISHAQYNIWQ